MRVALLTVRLQIPWAHSLKEKRMVVRSLLDRARAKHNVSAAEVAEQDRHRTAVLAFALVVADGGPVDSMLDGLLHFLERSTDAEITGVEREIR